MGSVIQSYFNFSHIYQTAWSYAPNGDSIDAGKTVLWNNKEIILVGAVIGLAILKIIHYMRTRPQTPFTETKPEFSTPTSIVPIPEPDPIVVPKPIVEMKSSLTSAKLNITIPEYSVQPSVTLAFSIDLSGSMGELYDPNQKKGKTRINVVHEELELLLTNAVDEYNRSKADITVAVTGFNEISEVIAPITKLTSLEDVKKIMEGVKKYRCDGGTKMHAGLDAGVEQMKAMAKANSLAHHFMIFLTDGDTNNEKLSTSRLSSTHRDLEHLKAELFAIAIGKGCNKNNLELITAGGKGKFRGIIFDTALGADSMHTAFSAIFKKAIATFRNIELTAPDLDSSAWSVVGSSPLIIKKGHSKYDLGSMSSETTLTSYVVIHEEKLTAPLDLSNVKLKMTYTNPLNKRESLEIPWNPSLVIDPSIVGPCYA